MGGGGFVAVAVARALVFGRLLVGVGSGRLETTITTVSSDATALPSDGLCPVTMPAGSEAPGSCCTV